MTTITITNPSFKFIDEIDIMKNIDDIFQLQSETEELKNRLSDNQRQLKTDLTDFLANYFGGKIPANLPLSKTQFISLSGAGSFNLAQDEHHHTYWVASGNLITIKDGGITYGHSVKELFQGQYEKFSPELKGYTLEQARELSKPVFNIISRDYGGVGYSNIGYELARNDELEIFLVWRKAGMAYVDRMSGSMAASSELQILPFDKRPEKNREQYMAHYEEQFQGNAQLTKILDELKHHAKLSTHFILHEGGKLNRNLIVENSKTINALFGNKATSEIVLKLEEHGKKKKISSVKNIGSVIANNNDQNSNNNETTAEPDVAQFIELNGHKFRI